MESMEKKGFLVQSDSVDHGGMSETGNGWLEGRDLDPARKMTRKERKNALNADECNHVSNNKMHLPVHKYTTPPGILVWRV